MKNNVVKAQVEAMVMDAREDLEIQLEYCSKLADELMDELAKLEDLENDFRWGLAEDAIVKYGAEDLYDSPDDLLSEETLYKLNQLIRNTDGLEAARRK